MGDAVEEAKPTVLEGDLTGDEGVIKEITQAGVKDGKRPEKEDEIVMHYVGMLEDGSVFDRSTNGGSPFRFKLGKGSVIKGWEVVAGTMTVGEKAMVTLKPEYAYGEHGSPPKIPPNATLKFELEMVNWISAKDVFGNGYVMRVSEEKGTGWERPGPLGEVTVKAKVTKVQPEPTKVLWEGESTFGLGTRESQVHSAWTKVVSDMRKDASITMRCTGPYLPVPGIDIGDATEIEHEVTMVQWLKVEDITGDRGVIKKVVTESQGSEMPNEGALVTVNIAYRVLDADGVPGEVVVKHEPFIYEVIGGAVVDGIDKAMQKMKAKEVAVVTLKAEYAYGSCPYMCPKGIKPTDDLQVDIELLSFERARDSWSMSQEEKVEQIKAKKIKGNQLFNAGRIGLAKRHYQIATGYFEYTSSELKSDVHREVNALTAACHMNLAACYKKEGNIQKVLFHCNKALDLEAFNVKALYRRACAYIDADNHYKAELDLKHALEFEPDNQEVSRKLKYLRDLMVEQDNKERGLYAGMFAKRQ